MDEPRAPRGRRQRAAARAEAAPPSALVRLLVQMWSWGSMSPQTMQKIAAAAKRDIEVTPMVSCKNFVHASLSAYVCIVHSHCALGSWFS